ncbi:MAG TPA: hypothetical protein VGK21_07090, partial [Candidatus Angelobacter sp.]
MGRASSTKAEWLGALETAAKLGVEQSSAIWMWMMQELRLGPQYFLAIREAVQQGRWRTAKNPKTYIKTVAKREAVKMGLVSESSSNLVSVGGSRSEGEEVSSEEALEYLGHHYDSRDPAKGEDAIWRAGAAGERDPGDPVEEHESYREWLAAGCQRKKRLIGGLFPIVPMCGTHFAFALSRIRSRGRIAKWVPKKAAVDWEQRKKQLAGKKKTSLWKSAWLGPARYPRFLWRFSLRLGFSSIMANWTF